MPQASKDAREALARAFVSALCDDFKDNGTKAIEAVRTKDPATYLKLCLQIMPKQDGGLDHPLAEITDDELDYLERLLAERRAHQQDRA